MDDTQTTGPATGDFGGAQTPAGEGTPSHRPEAPNGPPETHSGPPEAPNGPPGFSERGRMRRRTRFLRKARELAYRDLGGLVFDLHRFAQRNDALVLAKLETIGRIDTELRALEATLAERRPVTVLREAGVAACPRCAAIHGSDDRFCPNCGLAMDLRAERPMAGPQSAAQATPAPTPPPAPATAPMPAPAPAMVPTAAHTPAPAKGAAEVAPPGPSAATPALAAQTPSPAPPSITTPAPAPPAPRAPNQPATPAPASAAPARAAPAPAQGATPPSGPAPTPGGESAPTEAQPDVDQPTEIVRPPVRNR
jgi:hypothetical protein